MKFRRLKFSVLFIVALLAISCTKQEKDAKYVFYFIGDGMGFSHVALTEAYLAASEDKVGSLPLSFSQFPTLGMVATHSANRNTTCSSAAGTALATGTKTKNGMLGMGADSVALKSIAYKAHEAGYKVGIMSSATIDHATPASFYASAAKRSDYFNISIQLTESDFEFFGGGGFHAGSRDKAKADSIFKSAAANEYTIVNSVEEYNAKKGEAEKMILLQQKEQEMGSIPYYLQSEEGSLRLADVVEAAVDFLENEDGFFIMAEAGTIDWAAHSNDVANTVYETLELDKAVAIAYEFYLRHPDETLIIVTADHETGGVALGGNSNSKYNLKIVHDYVNKNVSKDIDTNVDNYMSGEIPIDELSAKANVGWTTTNHTATHVPIFAIGVGHQNFSGRIDNTEVPMKICDAMGIEF